jgi:hypothetical protein
MKLIVIARADIWRITDTGCGEVKNIFEKDAESRVKVA